MVEAASPPPVLEDDRVPPRIGRPPKLDDAGVATRERLLAATVAACVEHGFEGTTVADIARRAGISAPAIYNHFGGKVELLVAAGRWGLEQVRPADGAPLTPEGAARAFLAGSFADTRRLLVELHLAGQRHPEVAALLAAWHRDQAGSWTSLPHGPHADVVVKAFFALLLGLCHIDALSALPGSTAEVASQLDRALAALFSEEESR
jgi:AcrR family transcriptional regulator